METKGHLKNAFFWDVTPCASFKNSVVLRSVRRLLVTANVVLMKNGVLWDVTPCGSCKNRGFGGTWPLHHQGDKNR
jgi:hypothetical protein